MTEPLRPRAEIGAQPALSKEAASDTDLSPDACRRRIAELTEENNRLAEVVAARDPLLAVASHELRNPMTPILGRVEMLKRLVSTPDYQADQARKSLEHIEWLIGHFMRRATTLLDVSRITSGKLVLDSLPVDVCQLVRQVVETFRPIAEYSGCRLTSDLPSGELEVCGDILAVEQIVDNLVSNAIKYASGKPIVISARGDLGDGVVTLQVQDQGPGISASDQARIFQRFERAVAQGEHKGGFGVGLWVVRQLTEAMGGGIGISSVPGVGTSFCVSLPTEPSG